MKPVHIEEAEWELSLGEEVREVIERRGLAHPVRTVEEDPELVTRHDLKPSLDLYELYASCMRQADVGWGGVVGETPPIQAK